MSLIRTLPRNQGVVPISGTLWVWGGGSGRSVPSKFPLPPPRCLPPPRYPWEPKLSAFPLRLACPVPRPPRAAVRRRPLRPHSVLAAADGLFRREALRAVQERGSPAFRGPRSPRAGAGPRRPGRALRLRPPSVFGFAARHSKRRSTQTPGPRGGGGRRPEAPGPPPGGRPKATRGGDSSAKSITVMSKGLRPGGCWRSTSVSAAVSPLHRRGR